MLGGYNRLLTVAHKKWVLWKGPRSRDTLVETAMMCGAIRKEVRGKYRQNFTNKIGNSENVSEIWKAVNKAKGKTAELLLTQTLRKKQVN